MRTQADRQFGMTSADIASAPFTYETLEGRGLGVIAARDIEPGERLLAEAPLLVARIDGAGIPLSVLQSSVDNLAAEDRAKFFELSQNAGYGEAKTADGIAQTNGIPFRWRSQLYGAVYYRASRINHSCDACACFQWAATPVTAAAAQSSDEPPPGRLTVHATRRIRSGDEITINYLGFLAQREQRQQRLRESFGFECSCAKCALTGEALRASEARLATLGNAGALAEALNARGTPEALMSTEPAEVLRDQTRLLQLLALESPPDGLIGGTTELVLQACVEFCDHASAALSRLTSRARANQVSGQAQGRTLRVPLETLDERAATYRRAARAWAERAREAARLMLGDDSPAFRVYDTALARCWHDHEVEMDGEAGDSGADPSMSLRELWLEAGAASDWT